MPNASSRSRRPTPPLERGVPPRRGWVHFLKWGALAALVVAAFGAIVIATVFWLYGRDDKLPDIRSMGDYKPSQVTVILDGEGHRIGEIFTERRTVVPFEKIPRVVVDAFVAAEDDGFWTHSGIDYAGMVRAFFANVKAGRAKEGASTITQQVVKNLVLSPERTFKRKIQEVILARRLERSLTKEDIITLYLNEIYLGQGRYGIQEAARFYFGKDVDKLSVGEAAVLAGLPKSPNSIEPTQAKNAGRAKERQTYVLNRLAQLGTIEPDEAQRWINEPIRTVKNPYPHLGAAPEWLDLVRRELVAERGEKEMDTMGAVVRTTMDARVQAAAHAALQKGLRAYDDRHKVGRPFRKVKADKVDAEIATLKRRLPKGGPASGQVYPAVVTAVHDGDGVAGSLDVDLGGWPSQVRLGGSDDDERMNPTVDGKRKKPSERFARGDVIEVLAARVADTSTDPADVATSDPTATDAKPEKKPDPKAGKKMVWMTRLAPGPEGAVVVIKVGSREVAGLVGGYSSRAADFNRATMARRQPGSSFKPFVYAAAIDAGKYTAASMVNDAPEVYDLWKPQNYAKDTFEGAVRLRYALAKSINTVAIRVAHDVTPQAVADLAKKMGIASPLPIELSLALGSGEVTPLEMTNAIATFAAAGQFAPPRFVATIDGKASPGEAPVPALRPEVAYIVADMMRSVVAEGTGQGASKLGIPVSGKTGTSNDARDVWFVGFTPDWAIGVWVGYDDNRSLGRKETGGVMAVPIFVDTARGLGATAKKLARPSGVVEVRIDKATGLLAADGSPDGTWLTEVFLAGSQPTEVAPLPGEVDEDTFVTDEYGDEALGEEPAAPATTPQ
jgi:penicillin-binding protein 1A